MTIEIPLSKTGKHAGKYVAIIDDIDADLAEFNWCIQLSPNVNYAIRNIGYVEERNRLLLHRIILERMLGKSLEKGDTTDHRNHNGLDCRRENLRLATKSQNSANIGINRRNTSGYKGVSLRKDVGKWMAIIYAVGNRLHLGYFDTPELAHAAYCEAAIKYHGEFANFGANSPFTPDMFTEGQVQS